MHKVYSIEGEDESGLIPEGTTAVIIDYDSTGTVISVFYNNFNPADRTREEIEKRNKEAEEINSREQTPEEMQQVVGLLKRLASDE